jgi:hypothetical protein
MEAKTSKNAWCGADNATKTCLGFLGENGCPISDIAQVGLGEHDSEGVYSEYWARPAVCCGVHCAPQQMRIPGRFVHGS